MTTARPQPGTKRPGGKRLQAISRQWIQPTGPGRSACCSAKRRKRPAHREMAPARIATAASSSARMVVRRHCPRQVGRHARNHRPACCPSWRCPKPKLIERRWQSWNGGAAARRSQRLAGSRQADRAVAQHPWRVLPPGPGLSCSTSCLTEWPCGWVLSTGLVTRGPGAAAASKSRDRPAASCGA